MSLTSRPLKSPLFPYTTLFRSVEIIISDDGPGIAPDMLKRIGEPYLSRRRSADEAHRERAGLGLGVFIDRKSTRLNSSHTVISYAVFCLKKKNKPCEITLFRQN